MTYVPQLADQVRELEILRDQLLTFDLNDFAEKRIRQDVERLEREIEEAYKEKRRVWRAARSEEQKQRDRDRVAEWRRANPERSTEHQRKYRQAHPELVRERDRAAKAERRAVVRAAVEAARGPCVDCGDPSTDFHHRDPSTKEFSLGGGGFGNRMTLEKVLKEIDKCDALCASCHRGRHS